jgi:hypothetical protein
MNNKNETTRNRSLFRRILLLYKNLIFRKNPDIIFIVIMEEYIRYVVIIYYFIKYYM